jgi:hypothetical protein
MKTRFVGKCPVCEGDFKLKDNALVHHGFERPGDGMIHGDCFAVGAAPYELSCEASKRYKAAVIRHREGPVARLVELQSGKVESLLVEKYLDGYGKPPRMVEVRKAEQPYDFEAALSSAKHRCEAKIRHLDQEIERMDKLINAWTRGAVRTVEEEEAKTSAEKDARKAARAEALEAKRAKKVAFYQGRIDSALAKKKADSLRSLFESIGRASSDLKLSRQEMFDKIARNPVWALFGLRTEATWNDRDNEEALRKMWRDGYWPGH